MDTNPAIFVRDFKAKDYDDIADAGYPFDISGLIKKTKYRGLIWKAIHTLGRKEEKFFVAYSIDDRKAVGIMTLRKITDTLWGLWNIFVSSSHRRRGIGSMIYQTSFDYLRRKGVEKLVGSVSVNNVPSIKGLHKTWDEFLSQKYHFSRGTVPHIHWRRAHEAVIREYKSDDRMSLFRIYKETTNKDWYTFLEIDKDNFLERFIEDIQMKGLMRLLFNRQILIGEEDGNAKAYIIIITNHLPKRFSDFSIMFLFISPKASSETGKSLVREAFLKLSSKGIKRVSIYSLAKNENLLDDIIKNFGFAIEPFLVPIKKL